MHRSWRLGIPWLFLVSGCGAAPPPVEPPRPPVAVVAAPEAPSAPDLSPVPEPGGLLVVARWKAPAKSVDEVLRLFKAPVSIEGLLAKEAGEIGKLLDLNGSFDAAVILDPDSTDEDPKALGAVSIPVRNFDEARASAEKETTTTAVRPGVVRLTSKKGDKLVCDLTVSATEAQGAAPGSPPARLVCGNAAKDVEALREWLARGLPRTAPETSVLTATLRAGPLKDRYMARIRTEAAKAGDEARAALTAQNVGDPELLAAPGAVLEEGVRFLEDLDRLELRSSLATSPPEFRWSGALRFAAKSSWLTHAITDVNDRSGPVPDLFWRAPHDAYSATWGRGSDPHLFDGIRSVLHKAVAEGLGRVPILPSADKAALEAFVDGAPRTPGVWVLSSGLLPPHKKPGAKPDLVADARDLATTTLGWHVSGIEAPAAEYVAWIRQGLDVYNRTVRLAKEIVGTRKALGGHGSTAAKKGGDALELIPKIKEVKSPPGWPKGTVAFDVLVNVDSELVSTLLSPLSTRVKGALKDQKVSSGKVSLTLRLAIVPDGDHTWVGFSADLDELKKRMNAVVTGAPAKGTLATREGLEALRQPGQIWGGFVGVGDLLDRSMETLERQTPKYAAEARAVLASMPNKGKTPILLLGTGTPGQAPSSSVEVRIQTGTLADLTGLVTFLLSDRGRELLKKLD
jgi:hypothetical protein